MISLENNETYFEEEIFITKNAKSTAKRFLKSMSTQRLRLTIVLVSVLFHTLFTIIAPLYSAKVVDLIWHKIRSSMSSNAAFHITWESGGSQIFILLLLYIGSATFYALQSFLMASFSEKLSLQLRQEISVKLNRLPLSFFDKNKVGEIMSRTTNDLDKMSEALQTGLLQLFIAIGVIIGSLIIMFSYSIMLTLIFLIFMSLSLLLTRIVSSKTLASAIESQRCMGNLNGMIEEAYSGRMIIQAFNHEKLSSQSIHQATKELAEATQKSDFSINAISPAVRLVNRLGQVLIAIFGGLMLLNGQLTPGTFQAFFQYTNTVSEPLTQLSFMVNTIQSALASMERIYELLDEDEIPIDPQYPIILKKALGNVRFSHVCFGYSPDKILMDDLTFTVKKGQKIAIVGGTGAGKTTLVNLLMRFYEVNNGEILLDDINTKQMTYKNLREHFGMVLQDTWLFQGTIAENIAYGKPNATKQEIIEAAKAAHADFFIRTLPNGYDTILSNDAENISVGQRQLLTIARVMICNPSILILDEATSSVDTLTEMEIGQAMQTLMKNRTSFIIAHRLSTIIDADMIFVMNNGNIIEQGNHHNLLQTDGAYAELYNSQFAL